MTSPDPEIHIAGVLVQARPASLAAVRDALPSIPGAELVADSAEGRLAVLLEGEGAAAVLSALDALRELPGVLNVALVYQHAEPRSVLQQEMPS